MEHLKQKVSVVIGHLQMRSRILLFTLLCSVFVSMEADATPERKINVVNKVARSSQTRLTLMTSRPLFFSGAAFIRESDFNGPLFLCCVRSLQRAALPPGLRRPPLEPLRDTLGRHFVMSLCVARCQTGIKKMTNNSVRENGRHEECCGIFIRFVWPFSF